jgi:ABC-type nickel/cobalt efflux system permease component RcnA
MNKTLIITILLFLFLSVSAGASDNPFIAKKPEEKGGIKLPAVATSVLGKIMIWQHQLNTKLTEQVKKIKDDRSWNTLLPLIFISFFYGVLHAAGPGHGKVVVFSYFISRRSDVKKGIFLGNLISLFHAVSGIVIVLTIYFIIKTAYLSPFEAISQKIKLISYSLIVLIGLLLLLNSIFNITGKISRNTGENNPSAKSPTLKSLLPLAIAVGMVPCPGVVIIMLFALSFNLLAIGLAMSLLMALGMATTITLAGLVSILGRKGLLKGLARKERAKHLVQKGLTVFGSLLIITFGGMLLVGTL